MVRFGLHIVALSVSAVQVAEDGQLMPLTQTLNAAAADEEYRYKVVDPLYYASEEDMRMPDPYPSRDLNNDVKEVDDMLRAFDDYHNQKTAEDREEVAEFLNQFQSYHTKQSEQDQQNVFEFLREFETAFRQQVPFDPSQMAEEDSPIPQMSQMSPNTDIEGNQMGPVPASASMDAVLSTLFGSPTPQSRSAFPPNPSAAVPALGPWQPLLPHHDSLHPIKINNYIGRIEGQIVQVMLKIVDIREGSLFGFAGNEADGDDLSSTYSDTLLGSDNLDQLTITDEKLTGASSTNVAESESETEKAREDGEGLEGQLIIATVATTLTTATKIRYKTSQKVDIELAFKVLPSYPHQGPDYFLTNMEVFGKSDEYEVADKQFPMGPGSEWYPVVPVTASSYLRQIVRCSNVVMFNEYELNIRCTHSNRRMDFVAPHGQNNHSHRNSSSGNVVYDLWRTINSFITPPRSPIAAPFPSYNYGSITGQQMPGSHQNFATQQIPAWMQAPPAYTGTPQMNTLFSSSNTMGLGALDFLRNLIRPTPTAPPANQSFEANRSVSNWNSNSPDASYYQRPVNYMTGMQVTPSSAPTSAETAAQISEAAEVTHEGAPSVVTAWDGFIDGEHFQAVVTVSGQHQFGTTSVRNARKFKADGTLAFVSMYDKDSDIDSSKDLVSFLGRAREAKIAELPRGKEVHSVVAQGRDSNVFVEGQSIVSAMNYVNNALMDHVNLQFKYLVDTNADATDSDVKPLIDAKLKLIGYPPVYTVRRRTVPSYTFWDSVFPSGAASQIRRVMNCADRVKLTNDILTITCNVSDLSLKLRRVSMSEITGDKVHPTDEVTEEQLHVRRLGDIDNSEIVDILEAVSNRSGSMMEGFVVGGEGNSLSTISKEDVLTMYPDRASLRSLSGLKSGRTYWVTEIQSQVPMTMTMTANEIPVNMAYKAINFTMDMIIHDPVADMRVTCNLCPQMNQQPVGKFKVCGKQARIIPHTMPVVVASSPQFTFITDAVTCLSNVWITPKASILSCGDWNHPLTLRFGRDLNTFPRPDRMLQRDKKTATDGEKRSLSSVHSRSMVDYLSGTNSLWSTEYYGEKVSARVSVRDVISDLDSDFDTSIVGDVGFVITLSDTIGAVTTSIVGTKDNFSTWGSESYAIKSKDVLGAASFGATLVSHCMDSLILNDDSITIACSKDMMTVPPMVIYPTDHLTDVSKDDSMRRRLSDVAPDADVIPFTSYDVVSHNTQFYELISDISSSSESSVRPTILTHFEYNAELSGNVDRSMRLLSPSSSSNGHKQTVLDLSFHYSDGATVDAIATLIEKDRNNLFVESLSTVAYDVRRLSVVEVVGHSDIADSLIEAIELIVSDDNITFVTKEGAKLDFGRSELPSSPSAMKRILVGNSGEEEFDFLYGPHDPSVSEYYTRESIEGLDMMIANDIPFDTSAIASGFYSDSTTASSPRRSLFATPVASPARWMTKIDDVPVKMISKIEAPSFFTKAMTLLEPLSIAKYKEMVYRPDHASFKFLVDDMVIEVKGKVYKKAFFRMFTQGFYLGEVEFPDYVDGKAPEGKVVEKLRQVFTCADLLTINSAQMEVHCGPVRYLSKTSLVFNAVPGSDPIVPFDVFGYFSSRDGDLEWLKGEEVASKRALSALHSRRAKELLPLTKRRLAESSTQMSNRHLAIPSNTLTTDPLNDISSELSLINTNTALRQLSDGEIEYLEGAAYRYPIKMSANNLEMQQLANASNTLFGYSMDDLEPMNQEISWIGQNMRGPLKGMRMALTATVYDVRTTATTGVPQPSKEGVEGEKFVMEAVCVGDHLSLKETIFAKGTPPHFNMIHRFARGGTAYSVGSAGLKLSDKDELVMESVSCVDQYEYIPDLAMVWYCSKEPSIRVVFRPLPMVLEAEKNGGDSQPLFDEYNHKFGELTRTQPSSKTLKPGKYVKKLDVDAVDFGNMARALRSSGSSPSSANGVSYSSSSDSNRLFDASSLSDANGVDSTTSPEEINTTTEELIPTEYSPDWLGTYLEVLRSFSEPGSYKWAVNLGHGRVAVEIQFDRKGYALTGVENVQMTFNIRDIVSGEFNLEGRFPDFFVQTRAITVNREHAATPGLAELMRVLGCSEVVILNKDSITISCGPENEAQFVLEKVDERSLLQEIQQPEFGTVKSVQRPTKAIPITRNSTVPTTSQAPTTSPAPTISVSQMSPIPRGWTRWSARLGDKPIVMGIKATKVESDRSDMALDDSMVTEFSIDDSVADGRNFDVVLRFRSALSDEKDADAMPVESFEVDEETTNPSPVSEVRFILRGTAPFMDVVRKHGQITMGQKITPERAAIRTAIDCADQIFFNGSEFRLICHDEGMELDFFRLVAETSTGARVRALVRGKSDVDITENNTSMYDGTDDSMIEITDDELDMLHDVQQDVIDKEERLRFISSVFNPAPQLITDQESPAAPVAAAAASASVAAPAASSQIGNALGSIGGTLGNSIGSAVGGIFGVDKDKLGGAYGQLGDALGGALGDYINSQYINTTTRRPPPNTTTTRRPAVRPPTYPQDYNPNNGGIVVPQPPLDNRPVPLGTTEWSGIFRGRPVTAVVDTMRVRPNEYNMTMKINYQGLFRVSYSLSGRNPQLRVVLNKMESDPMNGPQSQQQSALMRNLSCGDRIVFTYDLLDIECANLDRGLTLRRSSTIATTTTTRRPALVTTPPYRPPPGLAGYGLPYGTTNWGINTYYGSARMVMTITRLPPSSIQNSIPKSFNGERASMNFTVFAGRTTINLSTVAYGNSGLMNVATRSISYTTPTPGVQYDPFRDQFLRTFECVAYIDINESQVTFTCPGQQDKTLYFYPSTPFDPWGPNTSVGSTTSVSRGLGIPSGVPYEGPYAGPLNKDEISKMLELIGSSRRDLLSNGPTTEADSSSFDIPSYQLTPIAANDKWVAYVNGVKVSLSMDSFDVDRNADEPATVEGAGRRRLDSSSSTESDSPQTELYPQAELGVQLLPSEVLASLTFKVGNVMRQTVLMVGIRHVYQVLNKSPIISTMMVPDEKTGAAEAKLMEILSCYDHVIKSPFKMVLVCNKDNKALSFTSIHTPPTVGPFPSPTDVVKSIISEDDTSEVVSITSAQAESLLAETETASSDGAISDSDATKGLLSMSRNHRTGPKDSVYSSELFPTVVSLPTNSFKLFSDPPNTIADLDLE